jgi:hypothetical protein
MAEYEIWLTDDTGLRISSPVTNQSIIDDFLWLQSTRIINDVGTLALSLPKSFDTNLLKPDRQIQVWRQPAGGALSLWRPYFIRRWRLATIGAREQIVVFGQDPNVIPKWRIVAYPDGESESVKEDVEADDLMKEIVDENLVNATDTDRNVSQFTIQANNTAGPQLSVRIAWRNVLDVLRNLSDASREETPEVWFDVVVNSVSTSAISYQFRTYTGQPGQDKTSGSNQVVFDLDRGNIENPAIEEDYTQEVNYAYATGQGEFNNTRQREAEDTDRINVSSWGRKEGYTSARREAGDIGWLKAAANAELRRGRPRVRFTGTPLDIASTRFGVDWNFGDKVIARYRGVEFEPIIEMVQINVRGGLETVSARLELES